jgi:hypothetical protein
MNNETKIEVDTKANKEAESVKTNLTIDWTDVSVEDMQALAQQALIVKLQGNWRKNGIPAGDATVKAADYKVGVRAKREPASLDILIQKLSPEDRKALIEKYLGA